MRLLIFRLWLYAILLLVWVWTSYARVSSLCSITLRDSINSQTFQQLYSPDDFQKAYLSSLWKSDKLSQQVIGHILRHDNKKWGCTNLGNFNNTSNTEFTVWNSFWGTYWVFVPWITDSSLDITVVEKAQQYIVDHCWFKLGIDGGLGKATLNAVQICYPPCEWKCKRSDFIRLKDKLYYDEAGTKKVYENNKFNDGDPTKKLYIRESDLASSNLSKDTLSAQWLWLTKDSFDVCTDPSDKTKKLLTTPEYTAVSSYVMKKPDDSCELKKPDWVTKPDDAIKLDQTAAAAAKVPNSPDIKSRLNKLPLANASSATPPSEAWCSLKKNDYSARTDSDGIPYSNYQENIAKDNDNTCACIAWAKAIDKIFYNSSKESTSLSVCEKCDKEKCNCGIKLNTNVPFIGRCIMYGDTNETNDPSYVSGDSIVVNSLNAFPVLMGGLIKILMSVILLLCFGSLIVAGVMMTIPGYYDTGKWLIKKVVVAIALLGASGTILYLINPNFFF